LLSKFIESDTSTSILNQNDVANHISVHPNPAQQTLFLSKNAEWKLFSLQGALLLDGYGSRIKMNHLSNGLYIIQAEDQIFKICKE
jgi:hypothetical protein